MTRTQCRRAQRAHSLACYKIGALQRSIHHQEATALLDLDGSKDGSLLLHSVAIHRSDCSALQRNVHYAAVANLLSKQQNMKSNKVYKLHQELHQRANVVKHERGPDANELLAMLPPVPPPLVPLPGAICSQDLERLLLQNAKLELEKQPISHLDAKSQLAQCATLQVFEGQAFQWNTNAQDFKPACYSEQTMALDAEGSNGVPSATALDALRGREVATAIQYFDEVDDYDYDEGPFQLPLSLSSRARCAW